MKNIYLIVGPSEGVKVIGLFAAEEVCKRRMREIPSQAGPLVHGAPAPL